MLEVGRWVLSSGVDGNFELSVFADCPLNVDRRTGSEIEMLFDSEWNLFW